ncbi:hypothetical protein ACHAXS_009226 [Conticribra weissflogii]
MLWPTRINPKISAFTFLEGQHSYDAVPFAPPGSNPSQNMGSAWSGRLSCRSGLGTLQKLHLLHPIDISYTSNKHCCIFPLQHYTITSKPQPEEMLIKAARELGKAMKEVAQQNPVHPTLEPFWQLERITDLVQDARNIIAPDNDGVLQVHTPTMNTPQHLPPPATLIPNDDDEIGQPPTKVNATPRRVAKKPRQEDTFGRVLEPTQHRYPTRQKVNSISEQYADSLPPYLVNVIIDYKTGELAPIAYAALHGKIGQRINVIIDEKTGKKKKY